MIRAGWWWIASSVPILLGGVLPLDREPLHLLPGRWSFPVGEARDWQHPADSTSAYRLLRGFCAADSATHYGVDLGNGGAGGRVRAAAGGLVIEAVDRDTTTAWGNRVVVAHRLADGSTAYSLYAHLLPGSIRVHRGEAVISGQPLGRVGRSGNATTPHLHFEVRVTRDALARWERAAAVEPLGFVTGRLMRIAKPGPVPGPIQASR